MGRIALVRAIDGMERAVVAGFEPAVRDDPRDSRRRTRAERGVARSGLGVQVLVARSALDVALVEKPLQARDEPRPVSLEAGPAEAVHGVTTASFGAGAGAGTAAASAKAGRRTTNARRARERRIMFLSCHARCATPDQICSFACKVPEIGR